MARTLVLVVGLPRKTIIGGGFLLRHTVSRINRHVGWDRRFCKLSSKRRLEVAGKAVPVSAAGVSADGS